MVYGVTISILIQKHFFRIRNIWSVKMWVEGGFLKLFALAGRVSMV
jgi:hypothetical protein